MERQLADQRKQLADAKRAEEEKARKEHTPTIEPATGRQPSCFFFVLPPLPEAFASPIGQSLC